MNPINLIGSAIAVNSLPDVDGSNIKSNVIQGYENYSKVYPVKGKLKATEEIIKQSGNLVKASKNLNKKPKMKKMRRFDTPTGGLM